MIAPRRGKLRLLLIALAVLGGVLAVMFAVRLFMGVMVWQADPARPIEGWMTPRYLVRFYDLPPETLAQTLRLPQGSAPRMTLDQIARAQDRPLADLIAELDALRPAP